MVRGRWLLLRDGGIVILLRATGGDFCATATWFYGNRCR